MPPIDAFPLLSPFLFQLSLQLALLRVCLSRSGSHETSKTRCLCDSLLLILPELHGNLNPALTCHPFRTPPCSPPFLPDTAHVMRAGDQRRKAKKTDRKAWDGKSATLQVILLIQGRPESVRGESGRRGQADVGRSS